MMWDFKQFGDKVAAIDDKGNQVTYAELNAAAEGLITNISNRCLVFVLCTNTIGSLVGYTAFLNHRVVPLLLDSHLDAELLQYLINTYRPTYLWAPNGIMEHFADYESVFSDFDYTLIATHFSESYPMFHELGLLLTTSGSTGSPKLVRQSYANIEANIISIVEYLELDETERPITTLPMNYTYGLSIINSHLAVGATLLLTELPLIQKGFWEFFKSKEATSFGGVPYTYDILERLRFDRMNLPSLRTMTQAGGKLSPELHKKFAEYAIANKKRFFVMYGQTEATARMSFLPYQKSLDKYGSMGIAIPGGKFSLIDVEGNEIKEHDIVGELVYEGPNVTLGYAESREDLIRGDERNGVLVTGDMAKMDREGFYYIVGRKKRFLKIFGNRINLDETEGLIKSKFNNTECACTGIDDCLYLFITNYDLQEDIRKYITVKTGFNFKAFKVKVIDQIPKNEAGKTIYHKLEEYYDK